MSDTLNLKTLNVQNINYIEQSDSSGTTYGDITINNAIKLDENKKLWLLDSVGNATSDKFLKNNGGSLQFGNDSAVVDVANTDDLTNLESTSITVSGTTSFNSVQYTWPSTISGTLFLKCAASNSSTGTLSWDSLAVLGAVNISNPQNNELLTYNSTSSLWENNSTINNVTIGGTTAAPGTFTTLAATSISSTSASITGSTTIGSPMILKNDTITDVSTSSGTRTAITANPVTLIDLSEDDTNNTHYANLAAASTEGTVKNIFVKLNTGKTHTIDLNFVDGSSGKLVSGTGNATKLIFSSDGQSASLIYIGSAWRITNTGAAVE